MESLLALGLGVGLAAACGFRVFVPMLVAGLAAAAGHLTLAPDFAWLATWPALLALSLATALEVAAYYVPWLDNALDALMVPAAVVAGTVLSAAFVTDMTPLMRWGLALVAGGGAAGGIATGMTLVRAASTALTGGLGNPLVSTIETGAAALVSALAVVLPGFAVFVAIVVVVATVRRSREAAAGATGDGGSGVGGTGWT
ncbi:MAG: DUF4126 domain-containing protein [Alphaproteobacteria bacterium]|nr:DUF4126 domain-containing protein [Alphaproteobacteria bacterium]